MVGTGSIVWVHEHGPELRNRIARHLNEFDRLDADRPELRHAAVAVAIVPDEEGRACFLLTRRASGLRNHAGQWALPGGRLDDGETAEVAARRELDEELGLRLEGHAVLGELDDYATRSGFVITPVILWSDAAEVTPNPAEVAEVYRVPLAELEHPDSPRLVTIPESEAPVIQVPLLGHFVHAPTAAVLYQLREVALHGRPTRVAHFEQPVFAWR
jgi:8-oxo-dGTP pyrophosphatase MutT (NUDIX family)